MQSFSATLIASIVTNLVVTNVVVHILGFKSESLRVYYSKLNMKAVLLDITSLLWGTLLAQRIAKDRWVDQMVWAIAIQVVHDVAFGMYLKRSASQSTTMSIFRAYSQEHGKAILITDAVFMIVSVVLSRLFSTWDTRDTMLIGTVTLYTHLLLLDSL
jgi:hypothetical protein|tara:strand:+ start:7921 stop:8394 length:474 start_codon:yes stop_codon:yes gene_type:complete